MRARVALSRIGLCAFALVVACTSAPTSPSSQHEPTRATSGSGPPSVDVPAGSSAAEAMRALCVAPTLSSAGPVKPGDTPPEIAEVEREVEAVRDLNYLRPVAVEAVTDAVMDSKLDRVFEASYPEDFYARRTVAWRTIGVIGPGDDLRESLHAFLTGQVVGFYDQETGELVYLGSGDIGMTERFVLAHELTHALDDQHFDLKRLNSIAARCRDEQGLAALGAVEGSAQYFATQVLIQFPSLSVSDAMAMLAQLAADPRVPGVAGVPPFVQALQSWPYEAGQLFVTELVARGGTAAVDDALRTYPVSTEQVLHPEKYPTDVPTPVDVPDLAPRLGRGFADLDVMQVGEEWLRAMLRLRLEGGAADAAAAGWDGGIYRAWSDGTDVAVGMSTAWDTPNDAEDFAQAVTTWLDAGSGSGRVLHVAPERIDVAFASTPGLLDALATGAIAS
jgi:hypothetical protein